MEMNGTVQDAWYKVEDVVESLLNRALQNSCSPNDGFFSGVAIKTCRFEARTCGRKPSTPDS